MNGHHRERPQAFLILSPESGGVNFRNREQDRIMCATMYKRYKKTLLQNEFTSIVPRDVIQGLEDTKRRFLMEALDILRSV